MRSRGLHCAGSSTGNNPGISHKDVFQIIQAKLQPNPQGPISWLFKYLSHASMSIKWDPDLAVYALANGRSSATWWCRTISRHYADYKVSQISSLSPERCSCNLEIVIFKLISRMNILSISCEIVLIWMPQDLTDDKINIGSGNGFVPSGNRHCLNQSWHRSMPSFGATRPQWVK